MKTQVHLTPADHGRRLSLEEFLSAGHQEGHRYELIEGKVEVSPVPNLPHELLVAWMRRSLERYAEAQPAVINMVLGPARLFLPREVEEEISVPEPDLAAYHDFPAEIDDEIDWQRVSPVIVAEVISTDTSDKDLVRNRRLYLAVPSVREYWMLDPRESAARPTLMVLRRRGSRWGPVLTVGFGETYTTRLLPGFRLVVDPNRPS